MQLILLCRVNFDFSRCRVYVMEKEKETKKKREGGGGLVRAAKKNGVSESAAKCIELS